MKGIHDINSVPAKMNSLLTVIKLTGSLMTLPWCLSVLVLVLKITIFVSYLPSCLNCLLC